MNACPTTQSDAPAERTTAKPARGRMVAFHGAVWHCLAGTRIAWLPEAPGTTSATATQPVQGLMDAFYLF